MQKIIDHLEQIADELGHKTEVSLDRPEEKFGDFTTNIAMRLAKPLGQNPRDIAEEIVAKLSEKLGADYQIDVAGPGFINITIPDSELIDALSKIHSDVEAYGFDTSLEGTKVMVEGTDPNPFKQLHIGHVYSNTIGEAISGLYEAAGATVVRANYQGDVGMHVAKSIWGMRKLLDGAALDSVAEDQRSEFLGKAYSMGASAFEEDEAIKNEITEMNKQIFAKDPSITEEYDTGRTWSLEEFEKQYKRLETRFDEYYFEQFTAAEGMKVIDENKDVFTESDGALVYEGEQDGLHTRVFVNSKGLPTYETKELGLAVMKQRDHNPDISITFTGNEIEEYFKVLVAVLHKVMPEYAKKVVHIPHGMVRLPEGKMSSRTGKIITADEILDTIEESVRAQSPDSPATVANSLGAIKYEFLKHRIGGDIAFSVEDSISLEGNSGPYIQYAHARARQILDKAGNGSVDVTDLEADERSLMRLISEFPETVAHARSTHGPQIVCTYLYKLAQQFNRFYENNRVVGHERQAVRTALVEAYAATLKNGLRVLNIQAPERM